MLVLRTLFLNIQFGVSEDFVIQHIAGIIVLSIRLTPFKIVVLAAIQQ